MSYMCLKISHHQLARDVFLFIPMDTQCVKEARFRPQEAAALCSAAACFVSIDSEKRDNEVYRLPNVNRTKDMIMLKASLTAKISEN